MVLVLGVATPAVLAAVTAAVWPHRNDWHAVDPAHLGVLVVATVAWIAWFNYIIGLIREVVSQIRQRNSPVASDEPRGPSSARVWVAGWVVGLVLMVLALFGAPSISAWRTPTVTTATTSIRTTNRSSTSDVAGRTNVRETTPPGPVRLPSGSIVGGLFVAGVLSAVAIRQLRRRHTYRYSDPEPGRDLSPAPLRPTLRRLRERSSADGEFEPMSDLELVRMALFDEDRGREHPGLIDIGTRRGVTVTIEVADLSGIAFVGPTTDDIMRALLASLLVRAGPGAAEVVLVAELAERLLPGIGPVTAIREAPGVDAVARIVESERIARARRFEAADVADAEIHRAQNPEDPLPLLVVVIDGRCAGSVGRWTALIDGSGALGIVVLFVGTNPAAIGELTSDLSRTVTGFVPPGGPEHLQEVQLFGLRADEVVELLDTVTGSQNSGTPDADSQMGETDGDRLDLFEVPDLPIDDVSSTVRHTQDRWPVEILDDGSVIRPLVIKVLGPLVIAAHGQLVATGLRSRAKALLSWYLVRPEGATSEQAVEALWPDTLPEQVQKQFWHAFGDLKSRFRGPGGESLDVLTKAGDHYRPSSAEITCDLWDFQRHLGDATRASEEGVVRRSLRSAVDSYGGDLLMGSDSDWIEPVRQDFHRRCLDAYLRLAELEEKSGSPDRAVTTLGQAIDLDRYAEEPYRRMMTLQSEHGAPGSVMATWNLLQNRLGDLDLEVEDATSGLYRSLMANGGGT